MKKIKPMRKLLCLVLISISFVFQLSLSSCQNEVVSAVDYHDSLVIEQVKIAKIMSELNATLETFRPEDMEITLKKLNQQIAAAQEKLKTSKAFKQDSDLLNATIAIVDQYQNIESNKYAQAVDLLSRPDSLFTDADEATTNELLRQIDGQITTITSKYAEEQKAFAAKYGLK